MKVEFHSNAIEQTDFDIQKADVEDLESRHATIPAREKETWSAETLKWLLISRLNGTICPRRDTEEKSEPRLVSRFGPSITFPREASIFMRVLDRFWFFRADRNYSRLDLRPPLRFPRRSSHHGLRRGAFFCFFVKCYFQCLCPAKFTGN